MPRTLLFPPLMQWSRPTADLLPYAPRGSPDEYSISPHHHRCLASLHWRYGSACIARSAQCAPWHRQSVECSVPLASARACAVACIHDAGGAGVAAGAVGAGVPSRVAVARDTDSAFAGCGGRLRDGGGWLAVASFVGICGAGIHRAFAGGACRRRSCAGRRADPHGRSTHRWPGTDQACRTYLGADSSGDHLAGHW